MPTGDKECLVWRVPFNMGDIYRAYAPNRFPHTDGYQENKGDTIMPETTVNHATATDGGKLDDSAFILEIAAVAKTGDIEPIWKRSQESLDWSAKNKQSRFPASRGVIYFDKDLQGLPWVVTSEVVYKTVPSKVLADGRHIPEQEVAQFSARFVDTATGKLSDRFLAQINGRYALNQLKRMSANELVGSYIFTLARNADMPMTPRGNYPLMLAVYDGNVDQPESEENGGSAITPATPASVIEDKVRSLAEVDRLDSPNVPWGKRTPRRDK